MIDRTNDENISNMINNGVNTWIPLFPENPELESVFNN